MDRYQRDKTDLDPRTGFGEGQNEGEYRMEK